MCERESSDSRKIKFWIEWPKLILWIVIILACIPYVAAARYALFKADDFSNMLNFPDGNVFIIAIDRTIASWKSWQGTWFSCFISQLLNPLRIGGLTALRVYLAFFLVSSFLGLYLLVYALLKYFEIHTGYTVYVVAMILLPTLAYSEYYEIYLWWTGACVYLVPIVLFEFGLATIIIGEKNKKVWMCILGSMFLCLMSGGVLCDVMLGLFFFFSLIVVRLVNKIPVNRFLVIPFVISVSGALVNVLAPGNFARHDVIDDTGLQIFPSFLNSFSIAFQRTETIFRSTSFLVFLMAAIVFGTKIDKDITNGNLIYTAFVCILAPIVAVYPVVLGYSTTEYRLPNRCEGILDISIYVSWILLGVVFGSWTKSRILKSDIRYFVLKMGAIFSSILAILCLGSSIMDSKILVIRENLTDGYIRAYANAWETVFAVCENSPVDNLIIEYDVPPRVEGCSAVRLSQNPSDWVNVGVAQFYGLDSVALVNLHISDEEE